MEISRDQRDRTQQSATAPAELLQKFRETTTAKPGGCTGEGPADGDDPVSPVSPVRISVIQRHYRNRFRPYEIIDPDQFPSRQVESDRRYERSIRLLRSKTADPAVCWRMSIEMSGGRSRKANSFRRRYRFAAVHRYVGSTSTKRRDGTGGQYPIPPVPMSAKRRCAVAKKGDVIVPTVLRDLKRSQNHTAERSCLFAPPRNPNI